MNNPHDPNKKKGGKTLHHVILAHVGVIALIVIAILFFNFIR